MKLCKDCRHCAGNRFCVHPACIITVTDYVTGKTNRAPVDCQHVRVVGDCGRDAKLFEPRDPPPAAGEGFV